LIKIVHYQCRIAKHAYFHFLPNKVNHVPNAKLGIILISKVEIAYNAQIIVSDAFKGHSNNILKLF